MRVMSMLMKRLNGLNLTWVGFPAAAALPLSSRKSHGILEFEKNQSRFQRSWLEVD